MNSVEAHAKTPRVEPLPQADLGSRVESSLFDKPRCCSTSRCLLVIAFVMICALVVALIVVSLEVSASDEDVDDFDEYFRTPEEQAKYEENVFLQEDKLIPTGFTEDKDPFCHFSCFERPDDSSRPRPSSYSQPDDPSRPRPPEGQGGPSNFSFSRRRREVGTTPTPVRHACCISQVNFISPETAITIYGNKVIVVQEEGRGQFFKSYNCSHVDGCTGCGCCQGLSEYRAVVRRPNRQRKYITSINVPGCCKCYNNLDPATC